MNRPHLHVAILARAVHPLHGVGGLERSVDDLVRHLLEAGLEITLITKPPDPSAEVTDWLGRDSLHTHFVPYRTFPFAGRRGTTVLDRSTAYPIFGWRAGRAAYRLVERGGIHLVHGHGVSALGYANARRYDRISTVPFVFNPHGLEEFGAMDPTRARLKRFAYRPLQAAVRHCARAADRVLATDRVLMAPVLRYLPVTEAQLCVVPNAVDVKRLDAAYDTAADEEALAVHGVDSGVPILLSVGRLESNKGFHVLARALARLRAAQPEVRWRWMIIGSGPYGTELRRIVRSLLLDEWVTFLGRIPDRDLYAWYRVSTLFVHPTLYEGSSLVTLEAMTHSLPVVATRAGGLPDKVKPGVTGWLVEPNDVNGLARAVGEALRQGPRLPAMGRAGRALVEREFAWTTVTQRLLGLYDELFVGR